jgi:hypothetical protein
MRIAGLLFLFTMVANAQFTRRFRINGTASASSDFAWGYTQNQVHCLTGPAQGSLPMAFVTLLVNDINSIGPGTATAESSNTFRIDRATNFQFFVSSGCPASHPPSQRVTDIGGLPVSFNPTIEEVLPPPPPPPPPGLPMTNAWTLAVLGAGLILAASLVLRRPAATGR